ncbi:hypothetical protein GUITHDRAFT_105559 [Guillardia theta CCMP2712]|uniref:Leucine-rich repeat-containing N-terminal plant-type domain-containing protein n=1 Tax=Guillardia theta (strain CCMP2712) TaxID=905079 RepID=L1JKT4_GUITC|nr:hypothetical protein GUITHDRAFT_105559 [Guillardia theta CCMP2712]EKX48932.1 hypothetical protein GUITHDRAFT_105559 [Guillardia theta CCMP2712]|eukprot:XP_005835912.1 hypothetical protein GUITHDRAFT_105559 [Guillardia theta CCMP2712]
MQRSNSSGLIFLVYLNAVILLLFLPLCYAPIAPTDKEVLVALYNLTIGSQWRQSFAWTQGWELNMDPCDDSDYFKGVTSLLLADLGLNGSLPWNLGNLTSLKSLYMTRNALQGELPPSLCALSELQNLYVLDDSRVRSMMFSLRNLALNKLNGVIPSCIGQMQNLTSVDLRSNRLTGGIPSSFGSLPLLQNVRQLFLSDNRLNGSIPGELVNAPRLEMLFLSYNNLTGTIPASFAQFQIKQSAAMPGLKSMDLHGNNLEGTFPEVVAELSAV